MDHKDCSRSPELVHARPTVPRNWPIFATISVLISGSIFAYIFTHITWDEIASLLFEKHWRGTALFLLFSCTQSILRTWQYSLILTSLREAHHKGALFLIVLVRNFCSDLLPARIGTTVYVYLVTKRLHIPLESAGASFAIAFAIDLIAIVPLILLMLFLSTPLLAGHELAVGGMSALLVSGVLLTLLYLPRAIEHLGNWVRKWTVLPDRIRHSLVSLCHATSERITEARTSGVYGRVLILGILIRIAKYLALYFFLFALLFPRGYTLEMLPFPDIFIGLCTAEFAAGLPISLPGGFGLYEGTWTAIFTLLGFDPKLAAQTGVAHHLFTQLYGYSLAALSLLALLVPYWTRNLSAPKPLGSNLSFALSLAWIVAGIAMSAIILYRVLGEALR